MTQAKLYNDNEALERMQFLCKTLNRWNDLYRDGEPEVDDDEYDANVAELDSLETLWPDFVRNDSPMQRIKQKPDAKMDLFNHTIPMLSLETIIDFSHAPLESFLDKVAALDPDAIVLQEFKYDGIALALRYKPESGKLIAAVTRGDGRIGENILLNLMEAKGIPRSIDPRITEVRGELVIDMVDFEELNDLCKLDGSKLYSNPRNAAAGISRRVKSPYSKYLCFYPYEVIGTDLPDSYQQRLDVLKATSDRELEKVTRITFTAKEKSIAVLARQQQVDNADAILVPRDGLVYKVDSEKLRKKMGMNTTWPNWAYAHKFKPSSTTTTLQDIVLTVGRTGKIAPTGKVASVHLAGVEIDSVYLHNEAQIQEKDLRIRDRIILERAGDVIPYVRGLASPLDEHRSEQWRMPAACPSCGNPIQKEGESVDYFCHAGFACKDQALGLFENACARSVFNIKGLGEAIIEKLYLYSGRGNGAPFRNVQDIFKLTDEEITSSGVSPLVAEKILIEIEKAKTTDLWRGITALGIRLVGPSTAKELAKHCHVITDLLKLTKETLMEFEDIGETTADTIMQYLTSEAGINTLNELADLTSFKAPKVQVRNGLTVCLTGSFDYDKNALKELIENEGFKVSSSVSKSTAALFVGSNPGPEKVAKASKLGVPQLDGSTLSGIVEMVAIEGTYPWVRNLLLKQK